MDDKAKLKAFSIENDSTGWLKKKLFKKVRNEDGERRAKKTRYVDTAATLSWFFTMYLSFDDVSIAHQEQR